MLLTGVVTAASAHDRAGAMALLASFRHRFSRLRLIWADQASTGDLATWLWERRPWRRLRLEMVKRPDGITGFLRLPKRGMVERTCGWFGRYCR